MTGHEQSLDTDFAPRELAPQSLGQDVPASLDALLNKHGSDPALDSRRYLRRPQWSRIATGAHAVGAGAVTVGALFASLQHTTSALLALAIAITGASAIVLSHASAPGRHAFRELLTAATAALAVTWVTAMIPFQLTFAPGLSLAAWHVITGIAAISCGLVVIAGMAQAQQAFPRLVRFCAAMIGVLTTAALAI